MDVGCMESARRKRRRRERGGRVRSLVVAPGLTEEVVEALTGAVRTADVLVELLEGGVNYGACEVASRG